MEGKGDHADLGEAQAIVALEQRIDGGQQGLHHVVEQMTDTDHDQDDKGSFFSGRLGACSGRTHLAFHDGGFVNSPLKAASREK